MPAGGARAPTTSCSASSPPTTASGSWPTTSPGEAGGTIVGGTSTRRENNATLTDQALFVSINADTLEEAQGYWDKLGTDATIVEPLAASAWNAGFGMLTDRFGVTWSVGVTSA